VLRFPNLNQVLPLFVYRKNSTVTFGVRVIVRMLLRTRIKIDSGTFWPRISITIR